MQKENFSEIFSRKDVKVFLSRKGAKTPRVFFSLRRKDAKSFEDNSRQDAKTQRVLRIALAKTQR
jgi:hypothetical protein